jgi:hypothetical protein
MNLSVDSRVEFNPIVAWNAGRTLIRRARRILVVDSDLGFALWLSATLINLGYALFLRRDFRPPWRWYKGWSMGWISWC